MKGGTKMSREIQSSSGTENPFASEKGIKAIARAMSIVLSEHYGEEIVVTFVPKDEDKEGKEA